MGLDSTQQWRVNSCAHKVNEVFNAARREARDECLWLAARVRELQAENEALRDQVQHLEKKLEVRT